ncbi:MAG: hypothetical protein SCH70_04330 [Candidatus Methanoperedens sp.]|nr:hypothetical protein [Candidatus Methanoperedens sp.]
MTRKMEDSEKLAAIQLLYTAYFNKDQDTAAFAPEFFYAAGEILKGTLPETLRYSHIAREEVFTEEQPVRTCPHCNANLFEAGVFETSEGGYAETQISFRYGVMNINPTTIQNPGNLSLLCGSCNGQIDEDIELDELEGTYKEEIEAIIEAQEGCTE